MSDTARPASENGDRPRRATTATLLLGMLAGWHLFACGDGQEPTSEIESPSMGGMQSTVAGGPPGNGPPGQPGDSEPTSGAPPASPPSSTDRDAGPPPTSGPSASDGGTVADAGVVPDAGAATDAGTAAEPDSAAGDDTTGMIPIGAPVADDCITDVSAGDHTFTCDGVTFLVMVDERCTQYACGLIIDVHGATMSGAQMRDNTLLHELAPPEGYLVVQPSATAANTGGTWSIDAQAPIVADFMLRMIDAFHVDEQRVHVTGFSQGSAITFYFLCNHNDILASAAPVAGASDTSMCMDDGWQPRVPVLYMNGVSDSASTIDRSRSMIDRIVADLGLTGGDEVDSGPGYTRVRHQGEAMQLDYIEHDYGGQAVLAGHCIPGGVDVPGGGNNFALNATTCTTGPEPRLPWGEIVLQWFMEHPRQQ